MANPLWKLVAPWKERLSPLWFYTGMMFLFGRLGDIIALFIGLFIVPRYITDGLGAIPALIQVTTFAALPLMLISGTSLKFINTFEHTGERGKARRLIRDVGILLGILSVFVVFMLWLSRDFIQESLRFRSPLVILFIAGSAITVCWLPMMQTIARALHFFKHLIFSRVMGPAVRLVAILLLISSFQIAGYFAASLICQLVVILFLLFCMRTYFVGAQQASQRYWSEHRHEMIRYFVPAAVMALILKLQLTIEPSVIRAALPEQESDAFYMITMFGNIPNYIVPAITMFLFPLVSQKFERGEITRHMHRQALVFSILTGALLTIFFVFTGPWLLTLQDSWVPHQQFGHLIWLYSALIGLRCILNVHLTYETAIRRFTFLYYLIPLILAETAYLLVATRAGPFNEDADSRFTLLSRIIDSIPPLTNLSGLLRSMLIFNLILTLFVLLETVIRDGWRSGHGLRPQNFANTKN